MEIELKERMIAAMAMRMRNGSFESLTYVKAADMNKGGRSGANDLYGRVTKVVRVTGLQFGVDYEHKMESLTGAPFQSQSMNGMEWAVYPILARSLKNGRLLLRATCTKNTTYNTIYIIDGTRVATEDEIKQIEFYTPKTNKVVFNLYLDKLLTWSIGGETFADTDLLQSLAKVGVGVGA